jgi:drug/metabolite transporter (DMT)-like permease
VYVVTGPLLISAILVPGDFTAPTAGAWFFFVLAGMSSAMAWVGIVGGYRRAPPAMLAPFEYTALIGAAIAGYLIWDEIPDIWVITGGFVIIGSGLFIVQREIGNVMSARYLRVFTASVSAALVRKFRKQFWLR